MKKLFAPVLDQAVGDRLQDKERDIKVEKPTCVNNLGSSNHGIIGALMAFYLEDSHYHSHTRLSGCRRITPSMAVTSLPRHVLAICQVMIIQSRVGQELLQMNGWNVAGGPAQHRCETGKRLLWRTFESG